MQSENYTPEPMNVGIFLATLKPPSAAEQRFQGIIFDALTRFSPPHFRFYVLTRELSDDLPARDRITYVPLKISEGTLARTTGLWKRRIGRYLGAVIDLLGGNGSRLKKTLLAWMQPAPLYYQQLRDLNLRIIWNLSQYVLTSPIPYIRIVWDVNHRIHSMFPEFSYTRYRFEGCEANTTESLARASYVIVGTEEGKRQIVSLFNVWPDKVRVIPFPTPILPQAVASVASHSGEPYIFYPARFWPHKNHVVIIEALRILKDRWGIRLNCILSGVNEGNLDYVLRYAERLGVRDQVEYAGSVSEAQLGALYAGAMALVYASSVGPDNLPPLEAMALGCPVITAEVPGAHEQYGDAALFFPPTDQELLAGQIKQLMDDSKLREDLIARGYKRAANWSPEDYVKSVLGILDEFASIARAWERCDAEFT